MADALPKAVGSSDAETEALKKIDDAVKRTASRFQEYEPDLVVLAPRGAKFAVADFMVRATNNAALITVFDRAKQYIHEIDHNKFITIISNIQNITSTKELELNKHLLVGKGNIFQQVGPKLRDLPIEARKIVANTTNSAMDISSAVFDLRKVELQSEELGAELAAGKLDLSLPAPPRRKGSVHPTMQVMDEMIAVFAEMGFQVAEGPDIEDDFHNFSALNFPPRHPAREMHDTFFLQPDPNGERKLLRTHTSPIQVRTMRRANAPVGAPQFDVHRAPPIRVIGPGRVYRCDSDATHTPMFHQMEGLVIDRAIHMGHLKWTLDAFVRRFFEMDEVVTRFRPHHFPFTEPSAEMDVQCDRSGDVVKIGEGTDWLEILGGGMVHPNILRICGLDPDEWQGFAFGLGVDRLTMLKYGLPDLRDTFSGDTRWLAHYGFSAFADPNPASGLS